MGALIYPLLSLLFGIGLLLVEGPKTATLKQAFEGVFEVSMRLIGLVIRLAPLAIFCFMFNLAAQFGWDLLFRLAAFVGVVLLALAIQMFGVYPALLALLARKNPISFFRQTQEASLMAFSTASSNATLPTSLRVADEQLGLPRKISRFVLTIGAAVDARALGGRLVDGVRLDERRAVPADGRTGGPHGVARRRARSGAGRPRTAPRSARKVR